MDVRCDKCGSEYELDDGRVTTQGVNVKCTSCGHVFRVAKAAASTMRSQTTGDWMIRNASGGQVFKFKELTTLQRWIVERRVTRDDEISKTGDTWKRLGDILELASFFQVAEQAAIVPQQHPAAPLTEAPSGRVVPTKRRSPVPLIVAGSMVVFALFTGGILMRAAWKKQPGIPEAQAGTEQAAVHIIGGLRELKKDTVPSYLAAETEFEKALQLQPSNTVALLGATLALSGAAEFAREDAGEIEKKMRDAAAGKLRFSPAELATMATELGKKQADAAARTERAFAYMKRTLEADKNQKDGLRAASRYYALTNAQEAWKGIADKSQALLADDPDFNYALGLLRRRDDTQLDAAISALQKTADKDPAHLGARYRLAEIYEKRGDKLRAAALIDEVTTKAPDHVHAAALRKRLEPPAPRVDAPKSDEQPRSAAPETFDSLLSRANKARQAERAKQAVELYTRALDLKPDNAEALTGLGLVYLDMEQAGNAISQFQKAVAANSRYSDAYMGLAEAYRARGMKRDAAKNYQRYLELAPNGAEAPVARQALKDLGLE